MTSDHKLPRCSSSGACLCPRSESCQSQPLVLKIGPSTVLYPDIIDSKSIPSTVNTYHHHVGPVSNSHRHLGPRKCRHQGSPLPRLAPHQAPGLCQLLVRPGKVGMGQGRQPRHRHCQVDLQGWKRGGCEAGGTQCKASFPLLSTMDSTKLTADLFLDHQSLYYL